MELAEIFKTLGDDNRIRIVNVLSQRPLCVCELEAVLGITQSNASRHLTKLRSSGIVTSSKNAQWVFYEVDPEFIARRGMLHGFLKDEMAKNIQCIVDIKRLNKYTQSEYTCVQLGEKQKEVIGYLNGQLKMEDKNK